MTLLRAPARRDRAPGRAAPDRRSDWWRDVLGAAGAGSMLVVVALWVHDRGLQDFRSVATGLVSAGRLTGLVGAELLLVQVFLMARVAIVERAYGHGWLVRRHRLIGFASFDLVVAHVVLVTLGYAATSRTGPILEIWQLIRAYPGMLLAATGTGGLGIAVLTSIRAVRRRLRYESWHLLHLYAYLGVGLVLPHELWTGTDFAGRPVAAAYWWTAYGVAAGSALVYRLVVPLGRSRRHRLTVDRVVPESGDVHSVYLVGRHLSRLPVRAGQFLTGVSSPAPAGPARTRSRCPPCPGRTTCASP